ncbi:MAG: hypothetical protein JW940_39575 [Polyangiaceae bacterium]|nr:hypothetical protein [Polyangiaceae bacterium]
MKLRDRVHIAWAALLAAGSGLCNASCHPPPMPLQLTRAYQGADLERRSVVMLNHIDVEVRMVDEVPVANPHFGTSADVLLLSPGPHVLVIRAVIHETLPSGTPGMTHDTWTGPFPIAFGGQAGGTYQTLTSVTPTGGLRVQFEDITARVTVVD